MAEERIDIVIQETGAKVVQRNIAAIGQEAKTTSSATDLLKRALAGLSGALVARELYRMVEGYTNLQNKMRATGLAGDSLQTTYRQLLEVSNNTRQSLDASVTTYTRLAQASKDYGLSQQQLIDFTGTLNQAVAISGATAAEAEASMIQLSQGMASGALRGDELRSVMEQLPAVADILAKELKVTRGELKFMGEQGEITTGKIVSAFANAKDEIAGKFAKTIPTVGQAFVVLKNQMTTLLGELDKELGASTGFATFVLNASKGIDVLLNNIPGLASALTDLGRAATVAAVSFAAFYAAQAGQSIAATITSWIALRTAVASGSVVLLGSAEAERQRAVATFEAAAADEAAAVAALQSAAAQQTRAQAGVAGIASSRAQLAAERELEVVRLGAQINDQGRALSLSRLAEIRLAEVAMTKLQTEAEAELAIATNVATAAQGRAAGAAGSTAVATASLATATTAAAGSTSLLGQAYAAARAGVASLWAVIAANPFTAIVVGVTAAVTALYMFRNSIKLGIDSTTTLGDLMVAVKNRLVGLWDKVGAVVGAAFKTMTDFVSQFGIDVDISLGGAFKAVARGLDFLVGMVKGYFAGMFALFASVPDVLRASLEGNGVKAMKEAMTKVGEAAAAGFNEGLGAEKALDGLLKEAQANGKDRLEKETKPADSGTPDGGSGAKPVNQQLKTDLESLVGSYDSVYAAQLKYEEGVKLLNTAQAEGLITSQRRAEVIGMMNAQLADALDPLGALNRELDFESQLMGQSTKEREISIQMRQIEQEMVGKGVEMTLAETAALQNKLIAMQQDNELMKAKQEIYDQIRAPQEEFKLQMEATNQMVKDGVLTQQEANLWLVQSNQDLLAGTTEARAAQLQLEQNTYAQIDALRQADLISEQTAAQLKTRARMSTQQQQLQEASAFFGQIAQLSKSENSKLAAIGKAAAMTQATIDGVVAVQKALAGSAPPMNYAMAAAVGVAAAANVAKIAGQGLPGFAFGGDFQVGGQGGTDSQLVAFRATPGEKVTVTTPTQEGAAGTAEGGQGGSAANNGVRIVNVLDPGMMGDYLTSSEGERTLVNVIQRNAGSINSMLGR